MQCHKQNSLHLSSSHFQSDSPHPDSLHAIVERGLIRKTTKRIPFVVKGDLGGDGSSPRSLQMCRYRNPSPEDIESYGEPWRIWNMPAGPVWIHTVQGSAFLSEYKVSNVFALCLGSLLPRVQKPPPAKRGQTSAEGKSPAWDF